MVRRCLHGRCAAYFGRKPGHVERMETRHRLDELVNEFLKALPEDLGRFREELGQNARAAFRAALARTDLVTREEFDVQAALLSRTRALVDELEQKVRELESRSGREKTPD